MQQNYTIKNQEPGSRIPPICMENEGWLPSLINISPSYLDMIPFVACTVNP